MERRKAEMFLSRIDSFPKAAAPSWTSVLAIVQAAVNKAVDDTGGTHRHRVKAPRGVTSATLIGQLTTKRKEGRTAGNAISSQV